MNSYYNGISGIIFRSAYQHYNLYNYMKSTNVSAKIALNFTMKKFNKISYAM